ncbi:MAG: CRISPR-associated helicase Cas3' [Gammaproteobacteria bacterium]|nr:CRISPR-associated helicase Cas3' [Gammaproteobacteria bacterium]
MYKGTTFYAHSSSEFPETEWQTLQDHLKQVGSLAKNFAEGFGCGDLAELAGILRDVGKYCPEFQARLRGSVRRVDHATWGAQIVALRYPQVGKLLAYAIAGHHAGLADGKELERQSITPLETRLRHPVETQLDTCWEKEINLNPCPSVPKLDTDPKLSGFQIAFLTRMLYSCLVDADFLDTDAFFRRIEGKAPRDRSFPSLWALQQALTDYLQKPRFQSPNGINPVRFRILTHVRQQAALAPGLFTLNVPTGGGKTLSSLAFGLDHAIQHGLHRIIFVIPFTSIVEQNAGELRKAFGLLGDAAVLEHHSAFNEHRYALVDPDSKDKLRLASENWDAPIIVTTAVQFFESLFANRPSQCRKLHNISNSVVILDEAQTLPYKLLCPCVAAIAELARNYRTSLVLCTATQPALLAKDGFKNGLENVRELAPDPKSLHRELERVRIEHIGELDDEQLIERLINQQQVLCILNNRRHAQFVFKRIRHMEGSYHLTTLMCARHRSDKLECIRKALRSGRSCRVISTSLIEAGVDVDFPTVFRADAGMDSIAQAAGRCNREGKQSKNESIVSVFSVRGDWSMPPELEQYAQASRMILRQHSSITLSPEAIQNYFKEVYWIKGCELDAHRLLDVNQDPDALPFEQMARKFRMIESNMQPIIVTYSSLHEQSSRSDVTKLLNTIKQLDRVGGIARKLQPYLVQVPAYGLQALRAAGAVQPVNEEKFGEQFLELVSTNLYDEDCGLSWENPAYIAAERSVY